MRRTPLERRLRAWLHSEGSLSRRIDAAFGGFRVQVVAQRVGAARPDEWKALGLPLNRRVHVREVVLWAGEAGESRPLVAARSVLPAAHARLAWRAVRGLGTRPLAELLFGSREVLRESLGLVHRAARHSRPPGAVWGRRARFVHRGVPLLLTEWFSANLGLERPHGEVVSAGLRHRQPGDRLHNIRSPSRSQ